MLPKKYTVENPYHKWEYKPMYSLEELRERLDVAKQQRQEDPDSSPHWIDHGATWFTFKDKPGWFRLDELTNWRGCEYNGTGNLAQGNSYYLEAYSTDTEEFFIIWGTVGFSDKIETLEEAYKYWQQLKASEDEWLLTTEMAALARRLNDLRWEKEKLHDGKPVTFDILSQGETAYNRYKDLIKERYIGDSHETSQS
jgi:hypothetical protein